MPESVRDRCTKAHEYLFLLTKSEKYYFDADAMREPAIGASRVRKDRFGGTKHDGSTTKHSDGSVFVNAVERNRRSVWTITTKPFKEAHFATFPPDLVEPCIKAGCPPHGIVLDPFGGAGTTAVVAKALNRHCILIELNPDYVAIARKRLQL
jgi:site-specific DNA-methyltransferase (adenine-specific)